jgi:GTPase SAR1 family protein
VKSSSPLSELEMPCQSLLIDYANLFGQTRLPNHYPPLPKYSVLVLGTTNAGKSSLLNHLYGLSIKEFGPAQIDTCFTLVEALPDSEFQRFVGGTRNSNIHTTIAASASADDVVKRAPMPGQWASDPRYDLCTIVNLFAPW